MPAYVKAVEQERLLLVEGMDEINLLGELMNKEGILNVQLLDVGGVNQFPRRLPVYLADARTKGINLECIGVLRDADLNAAAAFQSVCDILNNNNLPIPCAPKELSSGTLQTTVFIAPDNNNSGAIEGICWNSVESEPAGLCVDEYVDCLTGSNSLRSTNISKSKIHAFLAAQEDPATTVGVGAKIGYWPLEHPAFDELKSFIKTVSGIGDG